MSSHLAPPLSHPTHHDVRMIQQLPYRVGSRVRVRSVHGGYRLPDGLPENAEVVVVAKEPGLVTVNHQGRQFAVPMACIQSGFRVLR